VRTPPPRPRRQQTPGRSRDATAPDGGSAIIEFVFVAILVLVPLVYVIAAVATVHQGRLTVTNAARDVGRAIGSAGAGTDVQARADTALRISLADAGLSPQDVEVRFVDANEPCDAPQITPDPQPGAEFAVCVVGHQQLLAIPTMLAGRGITTIGRYVVHIDEFRRAGAGSS
jgi:Flp pilus assembly protein TadG